ncbi:MAG: hypothetical protein U0M60_06675, partial [Clostridia bacterium]|nr:hypothetical protein [Clostridia bacterium]
MKDKCNIKRKFRRIMYGVVAATVACTAFVIPPAYAEEQAAWNVDFETAPKKIELVAGGSIYDTGDAEHKNVLKALPGKNPANIWANDDRKSSLEARDYVFSFDFCAKQKNVGWIMQTWTNNNKSFMCFTMNYDGRVGFIKGGGYVAPTAEPANFLYTSYEPDIWYTADAVVDIDGGIKYYIDGKYLGENDTKGNFDTGIFKVALMSGKTDWVASGTQIDEETQALYIDNFKITYTGENSFYAKTETDGNNIKINFSETPVTDLSSAVIYACDTGEKVSTQVKQTGKKLMLTSKGLESGRQYAVALPETVASVSGNTLDSRYIYFFAGEQAEPSIAAAVLTDVYGKEYRPLSKIPITQSKVTLEVNGSLSASADEILSSVTLKSESGDIVPLSNPQITGNKVTLDIDGFLNMSSQYTLIVEGLGAIPDYAASFTANDEAIQGFFPVNIVSKSGDPVSFIEEIDVYASTDIINTSSEEIGAMITLAAYEDNNGVLKMIAAETSELTVPSMKMTVVGPNEGEEQIKLSVPTDTEVIKAFLWKSAEQKNPVVEAVTVGAYTPVVTAEEDGVSESADGIVSLVTKLNSMNATASVAVMKKGAAFSGDAVYANQMDAEADGKFAVSFDMTAHASGDYIMQMTTEDGVETEYDFVYVNPSEFSQENSVAYRLDNAADAKACADALKD